MDKIIHTPTPYKVEIQQYANGPHICVATASGDWVADCGPASHSESQATAAFLARACNSHAALVRDLEKANKSIRELCGMVNRFSNRLDLGNKVRAEDWIFNDALKLTGEGK